MGVCAKALWLMLWLMLLLTGREAALRGRAAPESGAQALTQEMPVIQNAGRRHRG